MKGEIIRKYRPAQRGRDVNDGQDFNRWLTANAVIASLFSAAIIAMAVFAAIAPAPTQSAGRDAPDKDVRRTEPPVAQRPTVVHDEVVGASGHAPEFSARQGGRAPN